MTHFTPLPQLHKVVLLLITTITLLCGSLSSSTMARDLFDLTVTSEGITREKGFGNLENFIKQLNDSRLQALIPLYTPISAAQAQLNLHGLKAIAFYPALSTALTFQESCSGTNETFQGTTRDDSQKLLRKFLEGSGGSQVTKILRCLVSKSPVDPVAGNPNSLIAAMARNDYLAGTTTDAGDKNLLGIGLFAGSSEASGFRTTSASLPINYVITIPNPSKPPYALIFDLPIRYINVAGADVVDGSFGFGVRIPILRRWVVTPMMRAGIVGSVDAGSVQKTYSGSVTSKVDFYYQDLRLSVNNMVGYYTTDNVNIGKIHINYDVENVILRNGLALEGSLNYKLLEDPTSWEVQFVDTRVTGSSWFNSWYDEIVCTVGTRRRATRMTWQDLRVGVSYTVGDKFNGFQFVLNYRF